MKDEDRDGVGEKCIKDDDGNPAYSDEESLITTLQEHGTNTTRNC